MDKPDFIVRLAALNPQIKVRDAEIAVKVILDAMCGNLARGGRVEIRGFGSFSVCQDLTRQKRNQKNSSRVKESAKYVPQFKPAKELRERADINAVVETVPVMPTSFHNAPNPLKSVEISIRALNYV